MNYLQVYLYLGLITGILWRNVCDGRQDTSFKQKLFSQGLRHVRVNVPVAVKQGENAILRCLFDLNGDSLYSVKWYKSGREFFRYVPRETPSIKTFPISGLSDLYIEKSMSNATHLVLKKVTLNVSGRYSCEVSADAPSFRTALVTGDMNVVVVPTTLPELNGVKRRYRIGDRIEASCLSKNSRPAANLTWSINSRKVDSDYVKESYVVKDFKTDLETSVSDLSIDLQENHFSNGRLKVKCTASIHNVYWKTTEKGVEEERSKEMIDSQEYRHNQFQRISDKQDFSFPVVYQQPLPPLNMASNTAHSHIHTMACLLLVNYGFR